MAKKSATLPEQHPADQTRRAVTISSGGAAARNTWRNISLIIGREYKNRITQRSFIITSIIFLILAAVGPFVPTAIAYFTSRANTQTRVVVINNAGPIAGMDDQAIASSISTSLNGTTGQAGTSTSSQNGSTKAAFAVTTQSPAALSTLQKQVQNGDLPILLVLTRTSNQDLDFTYYTNASATNDANLSSIQNVAQQLNFLDVAHRLGLTPAQTGSLFAQPNFTAVNNTQNQDNRPVSEIVTDYVLAYIGNILIYMAVFLYGMGVATGVAEEKGSRIMEILVNATTPLQLLAGKIVGIGAAGLTQMVCFVAIGIGSLLLQNPLQKALIGPGGGLPFNITGISISFLLLFLVYFILGFLLYATIFAAVGALVKRQDEVQNAAQLPMLLLLFGYLVSFFGVYTPDAVWMRVISYVPFWSPTTILVRLAVGHVAWWEILLTIVLTAIAIVICALLSARVYRVGILMYGQRPSLRQLAKMIRAK